VQSGSDEVVLEDGHCRRELLRGAELDQLGAGEHERQVPGGCDIGVAGGVGLVVIGIAVDDASPDHVAEVRALAAVVGGPHEQRRGIGVGLVDLEADGVVLQLDVPAGRSSRL
jgi:hypothetical protein